MKMDGQKIIEEIRFRPQLEDQYTLQRIRRTEEQEGHDLPHLGRYKRLIYFDEKSSFVQKIVNLNQKVIFKTYILDLLQKRLHSLIRVMAQAHKQVQTAKEVEIRVQVMEVTIKNMVTCYLILGTEKRIDHVQKVGSWTFTDIAG